MGGWLGGSRIRYSIKKFVLIRDSVSEISDFFFNLQACDGFLLSFILTTFLAHSFFSYFLTTFLCNSFFLTTFLQKYIFSSFEGQKLVISRRKNSFFSPILCENCPLHFNYFFKVFQILLYGMQKCRCSRIWVPGYGYHHTAGHIPIFSYFLTTFSS